MIHLPKLVTTIWLVYIKYHILYIIITEDNDDVLKRNKTGMEKC